MPENESKKISIEEFLRLKKTMSYKEIAKKLNICYVSAHNIAKQLGLTSNYKTKIKNIDDATFITFLQNHSIVEAAKHYTISVSSVHRKVKELDLLPLRKGRGLLKRIDNDKFIEIYTEKGSKAAEEYFKCSRVTILKKARELGLPIMKLGRGKRIQLI